MFNKKEDGGWSFFTEICLYSLRALKLQLQCVHMRVFRTPFHWSIRVVAVPLVKISNLLLISQLSSVKDNIIIPNCTLFAKPNSFFSIDGTGVTQNVNFVNVGLFFTA
jgi:hypothetical protein